MPFNKKPITQIAAEYSLSLRTLRFYEEKGLLHPERQGLNRLYAPNDEIRLQLIIKGRRLGFSLAEIAKLIASAEHQGHHDITATLDQVSVRRQIDHLSAKREQIAAAIGELTELAIARRAE